MKKYFLLTIAVMLCALSVDAQYKMQVNLKNGQVSEFNVSDIENVTWQEQAEEWHDVGFYYDEQGNKVEGWAMLTDDYVTALFEVGNQTFPVRIQERTDISGLFRLVNAYSDNYPVNEPGEWHTDKDYYIIIDATNPNQVYIPDFCETGMEWGYGMFGIWSYAGYFKSKGYTDDDVRNYFGTYANGVITFPVDALLISLAEYEDGTLYYSNRNGLFKLVLNPDLESVKVTGITLNMSSLSLTEDDTYTLSATVSPSIATDKSVSWSSSNSSVATVSSTGKVTAVNAGTATITATANDGSGVKAACSVTVKSRTIKVTGIALGKSSLSLTEGDTYTLSATVSPSNATDKSVTWKSSNTSVATVSTSGKVTAINAGTATITATANDGSGVKATCSVTVNGADVHNGHEYVDLGLPSGTKWATCNVGATKPEYYGDFYSFGETSTKSSYTTSNYKYGSNPNIPYNIQGTSYDVAHAKWGGNWVMPTFTQIKELVNNCTFVWTSVSGVYGGKFIGPNGNSIFMPAGGCYNSGKYISEGTYGYYWSSVMAYRQNWGECECLSFNSGKTFLYTTTITGTTRNNFSNGSDGQLVRPVMP